MLIKALLDLIYNFLDLMLFAELPSLPDTVMTLLNEISNYVIMGVSVVRMFVGDTAILILAVIVASVLSMNVFYMTWSLVFWVLRKIPMLNIKE